MDRIVSFILEPWPWWFAGPLIGLTVPALLLIGNRMLGISANLRTACAVVAPGRADFFRFDWKRVGGWNLAFALGILFGGIVATLWLGGGGQVAISAVTQAELLELGVAPQAGLVPAEIFSWDSLTSLPGLIVLVGGGFLVGFGAAYAGGCTSGHAIMGLADLQLPSLIAVLGFFAGGLLVTHLVLPLLFGGGAG